MKAKQKRNPGTQTRIKLIQIRKGVPVLEYFGAPYSNDFFIGSFATSSMKRSHVIQNQCSSEIWELGWMMILTRSAYQMDQH